MTDVQIHWFSIVNSVIVVFFLAGILSMIIVKTLRRDIARYNQEEAVRFSPSKIDLQKLISFVGRCYRRNRMEIVRSIDALLWVEVVIVLFLESMAMCFDRRIVRTSSLPWSAQAFNCSSCHLS